MYDIAKKYRRRKWHITFREAKRHISLLSPFMNYIRTTEEAWMNTGDLIIYNIENVIKLVQLNQYNFISIHFIILKIKFDV